LRGHGIRHPRCSPCARASTSEQRCPRAWVLVYASIWHTAGGTPASGNCPCCPGRVAAPILACPIQIILMHISWPPRFAGARGASCRACNGLGDLSAAILEMAPSRLRPRRLLIRASTLCPPHFAAVATQITSPQHYCTAANDLDTHPDLVPGNPSLSLITALCLT
jgi:hypothetical protein